MDVFWTLPPVSRTITALAVVVSGAGYSGLINLSTFVFVSQWVFTVKMVPQIWRAVTGFLITKPKFGILLDPYFLYQYGSGLERESSRFSQPGDFFVYTAFLASIIVPILLAEAIPGTEGEYPCTSCRSVIRKIKKGRVWCASMVGLLLEKALRMRSISLGGATAGGVLSSYTFLPALSLAYAYTYAQENPTRKVSFFVITFDSKFLPYAMLAMSFVMDGPQTALVQLCGLLAAHLYDFLTRIWPTFGGGKNYITTPQIVRGWFGATPGSVQNRGFGHAVQGRGAASAPSTGASTGVRNAWGSMGPGRRLGE
ncbi:Der1-like protein [Plenodomus tracheiphilus IPT5]|uniref:Derlin n=1 Tax=Plenodomus tracheiphilus IPT5 TaxID=1408161 RepID=A0A6A7BG17_9PLEO|nr:Der1-like protein [Plenodomus tracheiphilus IPT5]